MSDLYFIQLNNFKCKRCGYNKYDKLMFTGDKLLDDDDVQIIEKYVCRNCDYPIRLSQYTNDNNIVIDKNELLKNKIKFQEDE